VDVELSPLQIDVQIWVGTECRFVYTVPAGVYLIGSDPSCHLRIDAELVDAMHARLSFIGHRLTIEDLESENGVFIGGQRIGLPTPIQDGAEVHIGAARFVFIFGEETLSQMRAELNDVNLGLRTIRQEISQETHHINGTLGEGGMGLVLRARDHRIQRSVAMKVLRSGNEFSPEKLQRFVAEAQLTGQLEHPNIVPVYQLGITAEGQAFYTMKHVKGQTLAEVIKKLRQGDRETCRHFPLSQLVTSFLKICDALAFAHSHGVIHRDLNPSNIMLGAFGEVLVMDWGLAKRLTAPAPPVTPENTSTAAPPLPLPPGGRFNTVEGSVIGTIPFLSPEQANGNAALDERSDIFILGMILYEILALRPPVELYDSDQVLAAIRSGKLIPLEERVSMPGEFGEPPPELIHCSRGKLPEGLTAVVQKAMRHLPSERYQSVEALQSDIIACQEGFAPEAEDANWIRQLQLLLGRKRKEALMIVAFLAISQVLLAYFVGRIASDRKKLRQSESALAASNQRLEQIIYQLRTTADSNYRDAITQLRQKKSAQALKQINLALVGVAESSEDHAKYLIIRGHANTQLGFYSEALEDYRQAARISPNSLPIGEIETDLARTLEDGFHPQEGWTWEKINVTPPVKTKPAGKPSEAPPPPSGSGAHNPKSKSSQPLPEFRTPDVK
jgi:serine/threonine protein kinase